MVTNSVTRDEELQATGVGSHIRAHPTLLRDARQFADTVREQRRGGGVQVSRRQNVRRQEAKELPDDEMEAQAESENGESEEEASAMEDLAEAIGDLVDEMKEDRKSRTTEIELQRSQQIGAQNLWRFGGPIAERAPHQQDGYGQKHLGNLILGQMERSRGANVPKSCEREMSWFDAGQYRERLFSVGGGNQIAQVPFDFFTERSIEHAQIQRASGISNAAVGVVSDAVSAAPFLVNMAPVLAQFDVETGVSEERKEYWGNTPPSVEYVAEAGSPSDTDPTVTVVTLSPKTIATRYSLSSALLVADSSAFAGFVERAVTDLLNEKLTHGVLVGTNVGTNGALDADAITGIWNQADVPTKNHGTAGNFTRSTAIGVRRALLNNIPNGTNRVWLVSNGFAGIAEAAAFGANSDRFVLESRDGRDYVLGDPAFHFNKIVIPTVVNPAICVNGSAVKVLIWGGGIEMIERPSTVNTQNDYLFRMHANSVVIQPLNAMKTQQGAP